jgi:hypothetical protein
LQGEITPCDHRPTCQIFKRAGSHTAADLSSDGKTASNRSGEVLYFFNATCIVSCVDKARSEKFEDGGIVLESFDESKAPTEAAVFKDPLTAPVRIYVNDAGKIEIERIAAGANLTGIECSAPRPL